jgi:hypothetical protein
MLIIFIDKDNNQFYAIEYIISNRGELNFTFFSNYKILNIYPSIIDEESAEFYYKFKL